jgi:hypothetical protein
MKTNCAVILVPTPRAARLANPLVGIFADEDVAEAYIRQQGQFLYRSDAKLDEVNWFCVGAMADRPIIAINLRTDDSGFETRYLIYPLEVQVDVQASRELANAS